MRINFAQILVNLTKIGRKEPQLSSTFQPKLISTLQVLFPPRDTL
mgnify:FL=1